MTGNATPVEVESSQVVTDEGGLRSRDGEPTWEIARLFPLQGRWSESAYLSLDTSQLVEYVRGRLEFLPVPTRLHQRIVQFLFKLLDDLASRTGVGEAFFAPLRVRTVDNVIREPDAVLIPVDDEDPTALVEYMLLAIEVTSPGIRNRERDCEEKRDEYARARVPEYWIVDPESERVTVHRLDGDEYRVHGVFQPGTTATSVLVPEFEVDVSRMFAAGHRKA